MKPPISKDYTIAILRRWESRYHEITNALEPMRQAFHFPPDAPLPDTVWRLFDEYSRCISRELSDDGNWLGWYQCENQMGERSLEVVIKDKKFKVGSIKALARAIIESRA